MTDQHCYCGFLACPVSSLLVLQSKVWQPSSSSADGRGRRKGGGWLSLACGGRAKRAGGSCLCVDAFPQHILAWSWKHCSCPSARSPPKDGHCCPVDTAAVCRPSGQPQSPPRPLDTPKCSLTGSTHAHEHKPRGSLATYLPVCSTEQGRPVPGALGIFEEGALHPPPKKPPCMVTPRVTSLPVGTRGRRSNPVSVSHPPSGRTVCVCGPF